MVDEKGKGGRYGCGLLALIYSLFMYTVIFSGPETFAYKLGAFTANSVFFLFGCLCLFGYDFEKRKEK